MSPAITEAPRLYSMISSDFILTKLLQMKATPQAKKTKPKRPGSRRQLLMWSNPITDTSQDRQAPTKR